jgi:hypothetical protein
MNLCCGFGIMRSTSTGSPQAGFSPNLCSLSVHVTAKKLKRR